MKIFKFGGTSVGTPERMHQVADLITRDEGKKIVVLSAVSGTTNTLVALGDNLQKGNKEEAQVMLNTLRAQYDTFVQSLYSSEEGKRKGNEVIEERFSILQDLFAHSFSPDAEKILLAQGELISTNLFIQYLKGKEINAEIISALEFMAIDAENEPDLTYIQDNLPATLRKNASADIYITQGYICTNVAGKIDNLRRGGSDYTATLIGAALMAEEVQIWTDIDGMHNNDPRIVDKTKPISNLSFEEAGELAYFGAKILHPNCIIPAQQKKVPVRLKNTMDPDAYGTLISSRQDPESVKAIAAKDGITAIKIKSTRMVLAYGFLRKIFEVFEKYKTSVDMITTSEIAVSLTIDDDTQLDAIVGELRPYGHIEIDKNQSIVCVVGDMVSEKSSVGLDILTALNDINIRMISYGGSKNNISVLIDSKHKKKALLSLNKTLFDL